MARYIGPKHRLQRKEGIDLGLKSPTKASVGRRLTVPPGAHGPKGKRKSSSYGIQLREKQKVREMYGMLERQFARFYNLASKSKGATGELFLQYLERRLDNVVYRLGLAPTRAAARQLVNHGHVKVNEKRLSIPSYIVAEGDVISLNDKALNVPSLKATVELIKDTDIPVWLERKGMVGKVKTMPTREDAPTDVNESLIVEYYSR